MVIARKLAIGILGVALLCTTGVAQEHQRVGVEKQTQHQFTMGLSEALSYQDYQNGSKWYFNHSLSLQYLLGKTWYLGFSLPFQSVLVYGPGVPAWGRGDLGDVSMSTGLTGKTGNWKLRGELGWQFPTGVSEPHQAAQQRLSTSDGYHHANAALAANCILDPVIINATFSYDCGLPRQNQFGAWLWKPAALGLKLGVTEVLNDRLSWDITLQQSLDFGTVVQGNWNPGNVAYGIAADLGFSVTVLPIVCSVSVSKSLRDFNGPPVFSINLSYILESGKNQ
jgi:hypothetical protein